MQRTEYADIAVALDLRGSSALSGISLSLQNQTHLFVGLIDRRAQDWLAPSDVVLTKARTKLTACPHLPDRNRSGNSPILEQRGGIRVYVSNAVDRRSQSSATMDRERILLLTDASDTCRDRKCDGVVWDVFLRLVSRFFFRGGWDTVSLAGVAFIRTLDGLEGVL